jgi:putative ABC transport system ATP-binding protein
VLTAFENVELPLLLTSLSKKQRRDHVMTALGIVGLSDREKHYRVSCRADRNSASRSRARS